VRCLRVHGGERSGRDDVKNLEGRRGRSQLVAEKWSAVKCSERWLVGDRGALAVALRRERARGRMKCESAGGERPGYI
jgi:hypothetical protein